MRLGGWMTSRSLPKLMRSVVMRSAMEITVGLWDAMNQSAAPEAAGGVTIMQTILEKAKDRPCVRAACPGGFGCCKVLIANRLAGVTLARPWRRRPRAFS